MRLVIDTNVVFSALMYGGKPFQLLQQVWNGAVQASASEWMLAELLGVLSRPQHAARLRELSRTPREVVDSYTGLIEVIAVPPLMVPVSRDALDDPILACAKAARADLVVSGDADLRVLGNFEGIPIVTAAQALDRIGAFAAQ